MRAPVGCRRAGVRCWRRRAGGGAQPRTAFPDKRGLELTDFPAPGASSPTNVYGYEEIRPPGFTTVSLIVVGADGVLLADGQGSPAATQTLLDTSPRLTPKPLKWYVVGSDHGDHTAGNSVLPKDVTYIVHPTSRAQLERDAATAMGANLKAAAEAMTKGEPPPAPRPPVIVPPHGDDRRPAGDRRRRARGAGRCSWAAPTPAATCTCCCRSSASCS